MPIDAGRKEALSQSTSILQKLGIIKNPDQKEKKLDPVGHAAIVYKEGNTLLGSLLEMLGIGDGNNTKDGS